MSRLLSIVGRVSIPEHRRVFLSHASEDKPRFVLAFARALRARGVDVWVDRWEMLPGDSLVRKIFEEGIDSAAAVIVVISRHSRNKPWVAEELDAAVVKRIESGSLLIPVVLDGLQPREVPAAVRHLLFEPVPDLQDIDEVVDRVARAIHGRVERPQLGDPPAYAQTPVARIRGLDRIDSLILRAAGAEALRDCGTRFRTAEFVATVTADLSISETDAVESLEVLDNARLIKIYRSMGKGLAGMWKFDLTRAGLERYLRAYESSYPMIEETVLARLAGWPDDQGSELELTEAVDAPRLIVQHILQRLATRGLVKVSKSGGGPSGVHFFGISPGLRRVARS